MSILEQLKAIVKANEPNVLPSGYDEDYPEIYWLDDLYMDTALFNDIAGNTTKVTLRDLKNQAALIVEETNEMVQAIDDNNPVEVLDAAVDIAVVLSGLISKLASLGFNVSEAMEATAVNNLSKFPASIVGLSLVEATAAKYADKGVAVETEVKDGRMIFKNALTGKVLKPSNYVDNNLSKYVPEGFVGFTKDH